MHTKPLLDILQDLISNMDEGMLILDHNGVILHNSPNLSELLGVSSLLNTSIYDYLDESRKDLKTFLESNVAATYNDIKLKVSTTNNRLPIRMRIAKWDIGNGEQIAVASLIDARHIELKKRSLLRKTLSIEQLSRSTKIRSGKLYESVYEILNYASHSIACTRVNAWLYNEDESFIECIGNFDERVQKLIPQEDLPIIDAPGYFSLFEKSKIILADDAMNYQPFSELKKSYLKPNNVVSLMDIPIRSEGKIIGVVCFEEVEEIRHWTLEDQKYGLITAQMLSLAVETFKRKLAQQATEKAIYDYSILQSKAIQNIKKSLELTLEMNHLQLNLDKVDFHNQIVNSGHLRLKALKILYQTLADEGKLFRVSFDVYIERLINDIRKRIKTAGINIQLNIEADTCEMNTQLASSLGILVAELIAVSLRYSFQNQKDGNILINFNVDKNFGVIRIIDSRNEIDLSDKIALNASFKVIEKLVSEIEGTITKGSEYQLLQEVRFRLK